MANYGIIKLVSEETADHLYDSLSVCSYCKTPFKECDTIIPGRGLVIGETDLVQYKNRFWHYWCIFDYKKKKAQKDKNS